MKKTPPKKKKSSSKPKEQYEIIELPTDNVRMEEYVEKNRLVINDKIVNNIDHAINKRLAGVELFCFKNSNFVVVLNRKDFKESLQHIYDFSLDHEHFEICDKAKKTLGKIEKLSYVYTYKKTK